MSALKYMKRKDKSIDPCSKKTKKGRRIGDNLHAAWKVVNKTFSRFSWDDFSALDVQHLS